MKGGDRIRLQDGWTVTVTGVLKNGWREWDDPIEDEHLFVVLDKGQSQIVAARRVRRIVTPAASVKGMGGD